MINIVISGQYGDPRSDKHIWPIQKLLNDLFKSNLTEDNNESNLTFSVVLRVSGKVRNFGGEGPERFEYLRTDSTLAVDLVIPEIKWQGIEPQVIEQTVVYGVHECIKLLIEEADSINLLDQKLKLISEIESTINKVSEGIIHDA